MTNDELIKSLHGLHAHMTVAVAAAKLDAPESKVKLSVTLHNKDGSGRLVGSFDADDFLPDFKRLLDIAGKEGAEHG